MQNQFNSMFGSIGQAIFRSKAIASMVEQKDIMKEQLNITTKIANGEFKSVDEVIDNYPNVYRNLNSNGDLDKETIEAIIKNNPRDLDDWENQAKLAEKLRHRPVYDGPIEVIEEVKK